MSTTTVAVNEAVSEEAYGAAIGLGTDGEHRAATFATIVAALAREGWTGEVTHSILGAAMDGYDGSELDAARRAAAKIDNPWAAWADASTESEECARVLQRLLRQHRPARADLPEPGGVTLDLTSPPTAPRWVVPDFLVRGKTHMLSGATHALKTSLREAMMAASLTGTPFLGRDVPSLRWMVLDGENGRDDLVARWKALGITADHLASVNLTTREKNVRLGEPEWDEWLRREVESFKPDVLVLDTVVRVCAGVAVNDNDRVAELYSTVLVPLVDRHDLALLYCHHARKSGGRAGTDDAALGAVQWSGQAEQTITVAATGPLTFTPEPDGTTETHRPFVLRRPKGRTLVSNAPEHFEVRGRLDAAGALVEFTVQHPKSEPTTVESLIAALEAPLGHGALAKAVDLNNTGRAYRNALAEAVDAGLIVKTEDGLYERAERSE